tara:strand:- start:319 stop:495 length:177 start_codon:yes stop_codon:yes gene_type:complete
MKLNYLQFPVVRGMGVGTLKKTRAANKKAAFALSKNLKDPEFRAATKIMKYKKRQYYG